MKVDRSRVVALPATPSTGWCSPNERSAPPSPPDLAAGDGWLRVAVVRPVLLRSRGERAR
jgi:hypothetical protein